MSRPERIREDEAGYFWRRAIEEQVATQKATCSSARQRHAELSAMYRFRSAMLSKGARSWSDTDRRELDTA